MSRRLITKKRFFFNHRNACVSELILSQIIKNGCKSAASKILNFCFDSIKKKVKVDPFLVVETALLNIMPEVRIVKIADRIDVITLNTFRSLKFAVKLLVKNAKQRKERTFEVKLLLEMLDAYNNKGLSVKHKKEVYAQAKLIQTYGNGDGDSESENDDFDFSDEHNANAFPDADNDDEHFS